MKKILFYVCLLLIMGGSITVNAQSMENQLVTLIVTSQRYDYGSPWQKGEITRANITGCVIEGRRILTSAYALSDSVRVEVLKKGEPRKYTAEVAIKDFHTGLAIVRVPEEEFFNGLTPVVFSTNGRLFGETAKVYKWDAMTNLKEFTAELNKSSIRFYEPNCGVLMHQLSTVMNEGGNGEPVFVKGKLVGIATGLSGETKTLFAIASNVIERMLKDLADGNYQGVPFFWCDSVDMQGDENLKEYFGMQREDTGIMITDIPPLSSGGEVLKKNDIILSINGITIDDNGMYDSDRYGKLYYYGILQLNTFVGDTVRMRILRNKEKLDLQFNLKPVPDDCCVIPLISNDRAPNYYVFGGLVFQELSNGYFESWGSDWKKKGDKRMLHYYDSIKSLAGQGGARKIIVLNRVLADRINKGYHYMSNQILKKVNGQEVLNIRHLKSVVQGSKNKFAVFDFVGDSSIVLDRKLVVASEKELLKRYNIHSSSNITDK